FDALRREGRTGALREVPPYALRAPDPDASRLDLGHRVHRHPGLERAEPAVSAPPTAHARKGGGDDAAHSLGMAGLSIMSLNMSISLTTRAHSSLAPFGRTRKPCL